MMLVGMVGVPGARGRADDNRVLVGRHGVLYICRNVQERPYGTGPEMLQVQRFAKTYLQYTLHHGYPRVRAMRVKVMESCRHKRGVGESFARHIAASLQYRPLGSIRINLLPGNGFCVPGLGCLGRIWPRPK